jgi:hypothetical protein
MKACDTTGMFPTKFWVLQVTEHLTTRDFLLFSMKVPLGSFIFLCMLFEEFHVRLLGRFRKPQRAQRHAEKTTLLCASLRPLR